MRGDRSVPKSERVRERQEARDRKEVERINALADAKMKAVLESPDARFVLESIISASGINGNEWKANSEIHFISGKRAVGLFVQEWIKRANFDAFVTMLKERESHARRRQGDSGQS